MYTPQLAFGVLMTSSNYDDKEERVTGGRNGFGAKLTNIYSTMFSVTVIENGKKYKQVWHDNMSRCDKETIQQISSKTLNEISITFIPDYKRF